MDRQCLDRHDQETVLEFKDIEQEIELWRAQLTKGGKTQYK